jgi:Mor family transcriptional regulator
MSNIIDHYPESLRDLYDKLIESLEELEVPGTSDIAFNVVEWIRKHWNRRVLTPGWWGVIPTEPAAAGEQDLPGVDVASDPVRTMRGRELRLAIWEIVALRGLARSCHVASALAVRVEAEWSHHPIYVPIARNVDRAVRDASIWRDFGGFSSIGAVVEKHNISQSVIYGVYRRLQKEKDAREQPTLPGV